MSSLIRVLQVLLATIFLCLAGCATLGPPPYPLEEEQLELWFEQARTEVARDRGVALDKVGFSTVTSREMLFVLADLYAQSVDADMRADIRTKVFAGQSFATVPTLQAVYDPEHDRIIVNSENLSYYIGAMTRANIEPRSAAMTVLVHELAHAADDAKHDYSMISEHAHGDHLGLHMLSEGYAEHITEKLCDKLDCSDAFAFARENFHQFDASSTSADELQRSRASNHFLLYGRGYEFVTALEARDTSGALLEEALSQPPGDVLTYFDPQSYPDKSREQSRVKTFELLKKIDLGGVSGRWLKLPQAPYSDSDIPIGDERMAWVKNERKAVVSAAQMRFVDQESRELNSVLLVLYEINDLDQAKTRFKDVEQKNRDLVSKARGTGGLVKALAADRLTGFDQSLAEQSTLLALQIKDSENKAFDLYSNTHREGRYILRVVNSDKPELNISASGLALSQLRELISAELDTSPVETAALIDPRRRVQEASPSSAAAQQAALEWAIDRARLPSIPSME